MKCSLVVCFEFSLIIFSQLVNSIYVPNHVETQQNLNNLGIKTLSWQGNEKIQLHHNYSKVHHHNNQSVIQKPIKINDQLTDQFDQQSIGDNLDFGESQTSYVQIPISGVSGKLQFEQPKIKMYQNCPPGATGAFVYEFSCSQFLNCWKGRGTVQNCAPGTLFNPETSECDYSQKVQCLSVPNRINREIKFSSESIQATCPRGFTGFIPHYKICSKYIHCDRGREFHMDCPSGTIFDVKTNMCDFPYKSECAVTDYGVDRNRIGYQQNVKKFIVKPFHRNVTYEFEGKTQFGHPTHETRFGQTQNTNQHSGQHQSHYGQHESHFGQHQSQFGQPQIHSGHHLHSGDHHLHSGQHHLHSGHHHIHSGHHHFHSGQSQAHSGQHQSSYLTLLTSHELRNFGFDQNPCSDNQPKTFAHPFNCSVFLQCYQGKLHVGNCTHGTSFNPNTKICEYYNCEKRTSKQSNSAECPPGHSGLLPHPEVCSKFLNCDRGRTFVQDCGPGTVFNPKISVCDWPRNVQCSAKTDQISFGQEANSYDQNQHITRFYGVDPESFCKGKSGFYQNMKNCTTFFNCKSGKFSMGICQKGAEFNPSKSDCDYSYRCGQGSIGFGQNQYQGGRTQGHGQNVDQSIYGQFPIDQNQHQAGGDDIRRSQTGGYGQNFQFSGGVNHGGTQSRGYGQSFDQSIHHQSSGFQPIPSNQNQGGYGQTFDQSSGFQPTPTGQNQHQGGYNITRTQNGGYGQNFHNQGGVISGGSQSGGYGQSFDQSTHHQSSGFQPIPSNQNQGGFYGQTFDQSIYHQSSPTGQNQHQGGYNIPKTQNEGYGQNVYNQGGSISRGSQSGGYGQSFDQSVYHQSSGVQPIPIGQNQNQGGYNITRSQSGSYGQNFGQPTYHQSSGLQPIPIGQNQHQGRYNITRSQTGSYGQNFDRPTESRTFDQTPIHFGTDFDQRPSGKKSIVLGPQSQLQGINVESNLIGLESSTRSVLSTDTNADYIFDLDDLIEVDMDSPRRCDKNDFICDGGKCLKQGLICDGVNDCPKGDDEKNCQILSNFKQTRKTKMAVKEVAKFQNLTISQCAKKCLDNDGFKCKAFNYRKNDGMCFILDTNVGQTGSLFLLPNYDYYENHKYSVDCKSKFVCSNQKCIETQQICDGKFDCVDKEDEKNCDPKLIGYSINLLGSEKLNEGAIQIKAFGKTGFICDDQFGIKDAHVVCKELGFDQGALEVKGNSYFDIPSENQDDGYLMDDVRCNGNESSLKDCDFNGWGVHNCMSKEIVGIVCKSTENICPLDKWKCETTNECIPLDFLCDEVPDCGDKSDESNQYCESPIDIRLVGKKRTQGRLEIKYRGIWGTICDDDFNDDAAKVVCRYLGFKGRAVAHKNGIFGQGKGPIWLDQVFCQGNETTLQECDHWDWGKHNCDHSEDVGIDCDDSNFESSPRNIKSNQFQPSKQTLPLRCGLRNDNIFNVDDVHFRVVQGSLAAKGHYPWQASVMVKTKSNQEHWCGAVVISRNFVLTAAHCLNGYQKGGFTIVAGDYDRKEDEGTEQTSHIEEFYIHPDFRKGTKMNNDLALVKLKGNGFELNDHVQAICLPNSKFSDDSLNCTISGFGSIQTGKAVASKELRAAFIPIQTREVCSMPHIYGEALTEGMLCAGTLEGGVDACDGDSGGPLACLVDGVFTLVGLTSWGQHCGYANKPGVYVKVSHYRGWIDEMMRRHAV